MANFNKIFLMGNLTRDPQLTYLPSQTAVVDFGLAVNRTFTGKDGEKKDEVCFVDCRAFGKQAETLNKYMTKGRPIFIEGRLTFDQWTAQDGSKRSRHRVTVEAFQFLGSAGGKGGASGGTGVSEQGQATDANIDNSAGQENDKKPASAEDDIPF